LRPSAPSLSATAPPWKPRELPDLAETEAFELRIALFRQREEREGQRVEERLFLLLRDEQDLTGSSHARRSESRETTRSRADARIPARADRIERPLERRSHAPVQPLDATRLENDHAVLDRIDGKACVLEPTQHLFPLPLDHRGVAVDEDE
jgi:hypothetical protein